MDDDTTIIPALSFEEEAVTEQVTTATFEGPSPFGLHPLPPPLEGERAYLVEINAPRRAPGLLAIRTSLADARRVADSVHPGVADVTIRELLLPCDAMTLSRALAELRTWTRDAAGVWDPALHDDDETVLDLTTDRTIDLLDQTVLIGAFSQGS